MKNLLTIAFVFTIAVLALATDFPVAQSQNTEALTLLSASHPASTNATASTTGDSIGIEKATTHTFQTIVGSTNPSVSTVAIKLSLDGTNWFTYSTLGTTNASGTNVYSTVVGKFKFAQVTLSGTNTAATVLYLGR
jgi:hypothetical protein